MPQALVSSEKHLATSESILATLQSCVHSKGVQNQASLWPGGHQSKLRRYCQEVIFRDR